MRIQTSNGTKFLTLLCGKLLDRLNLKSVSDSVLPRRTVFGVLAALFDVSFLVGGND